MTVLTQGTSPDNKATKGNLDAWVQSTAAPHSVTLDEPTTGLQNFFGVLKETVIIVDLRTMKIVDIIYGAQAGLDKLNTLL